METARSFRFELRNRKRFFPWNTNSRRNWNTSYAEMPQDLVMFALRSSFPTFSSLIALENWFWVFSFWLIWFIIRSAPFLCMICIVVILLYQRLGAVLMSIHPFLYYFACKIKRVRQFYWCESWVIKKYAFYSFIL